MNTRTLSLIALVLWAVTIMTTAFFFIRGQTVSAPDGRQTVLLNPEEQGMILTEMRGMLASVHAIVAGLTQHDMKQVATAARSTGMAAAVDVSPSLMAKLPLEFKTLGLGVHKGFDELAIAVEANATPDAVMTRLEAQLAACVACHTSYRLQAVEHGAIK